MLAGTSLTSLETLRAWVASVGITDAAMESTAAYLSPV